MPIQFPPPVRGWSGVQAAGLFKPPFGFIPAPNMGNPNYKFTIATLDGGMGIIYLRSNPRNQSASFARAYYIQDPDLHVVNMQDARRYLENDGTLNMQLSGVTRDSTGAALGNCIVQVFRTQDDSFIQQVTSDGSGNWSLSLLKGGAFYLVVYLAGSPDVAGTSANTLSPTPTIMS